MLRLKQRPEKTTLGKARCTTQSYQRRGENGCFIFYN